MLSRIDAVVELADNNEVIDNIFTKYFTERSTSPNLIFKQRKLKNILKDGSKKKVVKAYRNNYDSPFSMLLLELGNPENHIYAQESIEYLKSSKAYSLPNINKLCTALLFCPELVDDHLDLIIENHKNDRYLFDRIAELQTEFDENDFEYKYNKLTKEMEDISKQLETKESRIKGILEENNSLSVEKSELIKQVKDLRKELRKTEKLIEKNIKREESLIIEKNDLENKYKSQISRLEKENKDTMNLLNKKNKKLEKVERDLEYLKSMYEEKKIEIEMLEQKCTVGENDDSVSCNDGKSIEYEETVKTRCLIHTSDIKLSKQICPEVLFIDYKDTKNDMRYILRELETYDIRDVYIQGNIISSFTIYSIRTYLHNLEKNVYTLLFNSERELLEEILK